MPGLGARPPDVDLRREGVIVRLITVTDDYYGLTALDVDVARRISAAAHELGMPADPAAVQSVQVSIDALSHPKVIPFWRAVLGYEDRADSPEDLLDPHGRGPAFWFQQMDGPQRNRIHLDVWFAPEQAEVRIAAAIAAGGRLVSDAEAPAWLLADPEGNEVCVATTASRD